MPMELTAPQAERDARCALSDHIVQFYDDDQFLTRKVGEFLGAGLAAGESALVIATKDHCAAFLEHLSAQGFNVEGFQRNGRLTVLDARETLELLMDGATPDEARFNSVVGRVMAESLERSGRRTVRAYGEMVDLLWKDENRPGAIRLEELWNELGQQYPFSLLCAYSMANFYQAADGEDFRRVCSTHARVFPTERQALAGSESPLQVALLEQQARALQNELAQRQELEHALREALAERRRIERELNDFVENAAEGLHRVGADGTILWANRAELEMLGYERGEYIGHHISEFYVDRDRLDDIMARLGRNETLRNYEVRLRAKDGTLRHVLIHSNAYWEDGKFVHTRCFTRDMTDRKAAGDVSALLGAIVQSSDDAIISKDLNGIIRTWNPAAERLFGYTADEAIGKSIRMIIPRERQTEEDHVLSCIRAGKVVDHFDTVRVRKDGTQVFISITVSPVHNAAGEIIGASKIARDVSERKLMEAERARLLASEREARHAAERANRVKDEFIAMLSHELRSPLNAIFGWAQVASSQQRKHPTADELTMRALSVIERNVGLQVRLIDDLLDVSRIVSGKLQLEKRPINVVSSATTVVDSVRPLADAKSVKLDFRVYQADHWVLADSSRVQQVLWNLLSNAVKFTPSNGRVELSIERSDGEVRIRVQDTGQGIPSEFLPFVFDRFRQAQNVESHKHGGLGLGLAVVRYIVEAHGGKVVAESAGPGQGATFTVTLPVCHIESDEPRSIENPDRLLSGVRVLVVDDHTDAREMLRHLLEQRGAEVYIEESASGALALLAERSFDLLLSDLGMPEDDGYSLISAVREHPRESVRRLPAIAVTAYAGDGDRTRALSGGYQDHIVKPVIADHLILAIAKQLLRRPVATEQSVVI